MQGNRPRLLITSIPPLVATKNGGPREKGLTAALTSHCMISLYKSEPYLSLLFPSKCGCRSIDIGKRETETGKDMKGTELDCQLYPCGPPCWQPRAPPAASASPTGRDRCCGDSAPSRVL